jgi:hypothetical protein
MKNGQAKLQNEEGWVAMRYTELVGGIQIHEAHQSLIEHLSGATAEVRLADGSVTAGFANTAGKIMFR